MNTDLNQTFNTGYGSSLLFPLCVKVIGTSVENEKGEFSLDEVKTFNLVFNPQNWFVGACLSDDRFIWFYHPTLCSPLVFLSHSLSLSLSLSLSHYAPVTVFCFSSDSLLFFSIRKFLCLRYLPRYD